MRGRIDRRFRHPGEEIACDYLEREHRLRLLRHNYHVGSGEIDLIMLGIDAVHFVEVKSWAATETGAESEFHPLHSFSRAKQKRMQGAAIRFMSELETLLSRPKPNDEQHLYLRLIARESAAGALDLLHDRNLSFDLVWMKSSGADEKPDQATYSPEYFPSLF